MKYIYSVLILALIATSINAQNDLVNNILKDYSAKAGIKLLEGRKLVKEEPSKSAAIIYVPSVITAHIASEGGVIMSKDTFAYNDKGLQAVSITQTNNGAGWQNIQMDSSLYYSSGLTRTQSYYTWNISEWRFMQRNTTEYDENGNTTLFILENLTESGWTKFQIATTYNEQGLTVESVISNIEGENIIPQQRYVYAYNGQGETTEIRTEIRTGGTWMNYSQKFYEYNETGFLTSEQYSLWGGAEWLPNERIDYTPNESGKVLYYISKYRASGVLEKSDSVSYTYYDNGDVQTMYVAYWDADHWVNLDLFEYTYNDKGDYLNFSRHLWKENTWMKLMRYAYTYNPKGHIASLIIEEGTDNNEWANYERSVYEFDEHDDVVKGEYFAWNNNAWVNSNGGLNMEYAYYTAYLAEAEYIPVNGPIAADDDDLNPNKFALVQNYPNPFNPETKISFSLPESGKASLKIYDMLGREVAELVNGNMEKGAHTVNFSGRNLSSGVYIYRLQSGNFTESKKMMLMK